ncbi:MAG: CYTH domain-containing protein, partial [Corynebacteriales bacterium]|nr:CYTH domain-containing protein [Mycobacteriales bacterium]
MGIEFEAKVLDIDVNGIKAAITDAGAEAMGSVLLRRYVFDIDPGDRSRWIRLRDEGHRVTLATKHIRNDEIDGTYETEVVVSDFDTTRELLGQLGYQPKSYQENRRTSYRLGNIHLEIDEWPHIPAYLEIEATSKEEVLQAAQRIGITEQQLTAKNTTDVYGLYGIDISTMS